MTGPDPLLDDVMAEVRGLFRAADLDDPALEARLLVSGLLDLEPAGLISRGRSPISSEDVERIRAAAARRVAGEPVYRILGWREFYGLRLGLSSGTLEPRPDTEVLVDAVLPILRQFVGEGRKPHILDLGTGTGAICLALLHECPDASGFGTDISADALATAKANAEANGLGGRFVALESDWFSQVRGRFDVIVSNPPYIPSADIACLDREVRDHDPLAALDGGSDGLDPYRIIANQAAQHLCEDGFVGVEFGWDQLAAVRSIFEATGFVAQHAMRDYGGRDRALIFALKPGYSGE
ncbi:peptide chain release factor N(5)-glutamine methyltransferase [Rhizobium sp. C4]|uniref:peptide chain release factor N(5)-glutamine methyltransferase n=1 Tax=Rhizobium sp. C4 TaxID=1349800 RepID=UPI001E2C0BC4|nr:peptide chain release factor N(5)-glutamine methyltransferase [Rhizobium sp. C4]MCD2175741.1 peptide chain release factor N(5)-glutamine methyltransferase [Rhizobium sp. C4]